MYARTPALLMALLLLMGAVVSGCGYGFSPQGPSVLRQQQEQGKGSLALGTVENPTLEVWIEPVLRNKLRDEITSRENVTWAQPDTADMVMDLDIVRYIIDAAIQNREEQTLRYKVEIVLEATLKDAAEGVVIWRSGPVKRIEYFLNDNDRSAAEHEVVQQAVLVLVDRMGHSF